MYSSSRIALLSLALALTACGGGGGGGGGDGAASPPPSTIPTPNLDTNATAALLEYEGVYFFGGASTTPESDQSYIRSVRNGNTTSHTRVTELVTSRYAGADSHYGNGLFDEVPRTTFMSENGARSSSPTHRLIYNPGNVTNLAFQDWQLEVTLTDLAGTAMDPFLKQSRSGAYTPTVSGVFSAGAKSVALRYKAGVDLITSPYTGASPIYKEGTINSYVRELTDLPAALCLSKASATVSLHIRVKADNTVDLSAYNNSTCSGSTPAFTASTVWELKTMSEQPYVDFSLPAGIKLSDYDPAFTTDEFASGIRLVLAKPPGYDRFLKVYYFEADAYTDDPVRHMNLQAADDLKAALALP